MPFENEHSCRLKEPGLFVRIRELWRKGGERGIGGPLKSNPSGGTVTQAIRYDRTKVPAADARANCREKGGSFEAATGRGPVKETESEYLDPKRNPMIRTGGGKE
jgi:hypothetical protein